MGRLILVCSGLDPLIQNGKGVLTNRDLRFVDSIGVQLSICDPSFLMNIKGSTKDLEGTNRLLQDHVTSLLELELYCVTYSVKRIYVFLCLYVYIESWSTK